MTSHIDIMINLLRDSDRPASHAKLMDDAASMLKDSWQCVKLWDAFERLETVDAALIERVNQEIINDSEGQTDMHTCYVSGDEDTIFEAFLYVVKKQLLENVGIKYRETHGEKQIVATE